MNIFNIKPTNGKNIEEQQLLINLVDHGKIGTE
jgi:hypothetical protein